MFTFSYPWPANESFRSKVAYFCMEFGIHQSLKTYAGGLGFLAGSQMRSAYELKMPMLGIGILWKYGYYDQVRKSDQRMDVLFQEKVYGFLKPTGIRLNLTVNQHTVVATAYYLPPEVFTTCPVFLLSTDLPENDYLARTICHRLYDANPEARLAADILLGRGGAKLLEAIGWEPDLYHLNESHGLPLAFYLYERYKDVAEVKKRLVFTNHTPEEAGNQKTGISLLNKMGFFGGLPLATVQAISNVENDNLDFTRTALRLSGRANAVSALHLDTIRKIWGNEPGMARLTSITNAQNFNYWADAELYDALRQRNDEMLLKRKAHGKQNLFEEVADQNGEIYDTRVFTLVFAKRFAGYKRAALLLQDMDRFHQLISNPERPVQIIWAGKPYPMDYAAIGCFDHITEICKTYSNCATLVGYELRQSKLLKRGADLWLNVPRLGHEASGTSGMAAAMNGAVNLSIPDGWFPEFVRDRQNGFVIPPADSSLPEHEQDDADAAKLYDILEIEILPLYYDYPARWLELVKNSMNDIYPEFDSNRMITEYYEKLYNA